MHGGNEIVDMKACCEVYNSIKIRHNLILFPIANIYGITKGDLKTMENPWA